MLLLRSIRLALAMPLLLLPWQAQAGPAPVAARAEAAPIAPAMAPAASPTPAPQAAPLPAAEPQPAPPLRATHVVDLTTRTVLFAEHDDVPAPPASMAKLMAVYTAFAEIAAGRARLDQPVTVSEAAARDWSGRGSTMRVQAGATHSLAELLDAIIGVSANDGAVVLAEGLAGSVPAFMALAERHRVRLGLTVSRFANPSGWPDGRATIATAAEMARLAAALRADFPALYDRFFARRREGPPHPDSGIDRLIRAVEGADGLKTGTTREAGHCVAMMAERGGRRLALVITGRADSAERLADAVRLFDAGFAATRPVTLLPAGAEVARLPLRRGRAGEVRLGPAADVQLALPAAEAQRRVATEVRLDPPPRRARAGDRLGWLVVVAPGHSSVHPLVALADAP